MENPFSNANNAMSFHSAASDAERIEECRRRAVRHVQCRYCGYEPPTEQRPSCCPKCHGGCWETFVQVDKLRPAEGEDAAPQPVRIAPAAGARVARVGETTAR